MSTLGWASAGHNPWQNLTSMRAYWEKGNKWATENKFPIWFYEAFDVPLKGNDSFKGHFGWWRLTENSKSTYIEGYIEKVLELNRFSTTDNVTATNVSGVTTTTLSIIITGVVTLSLLVLLIFISVAVLFYRLKRIHQHLSKEDIRHFRKGVPDDVASNQGDIVTNAGILKCPYDASFELKKHQIKIDQDVVLGTGQFGCVFQATVDAKQDDSSTPVALKMVKVGDTRTALGELLNEIKMLIYIGKHRNIVSLVGAYTAELHKNVYMATELCSLGSLEAHLRNKDNFEGAASYTSDGEGVDELAKQMYSNTGVVTHLPEMLQWSQEIAHGMEYLHTTSVIHGDLATKNILLTAQKTAKITNFGLHRVDDYKHFIKTDQGPLPWRGMAVESLREGEFSDKSDVWSYGVTLWEIFTLGDVPFPDFTMTRDFPAQLETGLRLPRPFYASPNLYDVMRDCWNIQPTERPTFSVLTHLIAKINAEQTDMQN